MKTITVRLPEELIECVDIYSLRSGKNRSEIIREAISYYINPNNKNRCRRSKPRKICPY